MFLFNRSTILAFILPLTLTACHDDDAAVVNMTPDETINVMPVATTAADRHGLVGQQILLQGAATDDDDDSLSLAWTQSGGPAVVLSNDSTEAPSFLPFSIGVYQFSLTANDGTDDSDPVTMSVSVHDIDGGEDHSLALKPDGTLLAWGYNLQGQLGDGSNNLSAVPIPVCDTGKTDCNANPMTGVVAIATGRNHSLALKADGRVWAWGEDVYGQLGGGLNTNVNTPQIVCNVGATNCTDDPLTDVVHIAAGYLFSVALKSDGTVVAWGYNGNGQLGAGTVSFTSPVPVQVCAPGQTSPCSAFLNDVAFITAGGGGHTIALTDDGTLLSWGHNKAGQVGMNDISETNISVPVLVYKPGETAPCIEGFQGAVAIDAWSGTSFALRADGSLWGWGGNNAGELSAVTVITCPSGSTCSPVPIAVCETGNSPCTTPFTNVAGFATGRRFVTALRNDGSVWIWGNNVDGKLGNGSISSAIFLPAPVCDVGQSAPCDTFLTNIQAVTAGSFHALALRADGSLASWGDNEFGQLGNNNDPNDETIPVIVTGY